MQAQLFSEERKTGRSPKPTAARQRVEGGAGGGQEETGVTSIPQEISPLISRVIARDRGLAGGQCSGRRWRRRTARGGRFRMDGRDQRIDGVGGRCKGAEVRGSERMGAGD